MKQLSREFNTYELQTFYTDLLARSRGYKDLLIHGRVMKITSEKLNSVVRSRNRIQRLVHEAQKMGIVPKTRKK